MLRGLLIFAMLTNFLPITVLAANSGEVVINEIAWAGSQDSGTDEWIELFNNSGRTIDLSNWVIVDDEATKYVIAEGNTIAPYGYFLIEHSEQAVANVQSDTVLSLSLANSGDKLELKDASGNLIDSVNVAGGAWYAGSSTSRATMERKNSMVSGDLAENWVTSTGGIGALSSGGSSITGTPRVINSQSDFPVFAPRLDVILPIGEIKTGDEIEIKVFGKNLSEIYAYGFDVNYESDLLEFVDAQASGFLSFEGAAQTGFQFAFEDSIPGKLVVAQAQIEEEKQAVSGDGDLVKLKFRVLGDVGSEVFVNLNSAFAGGGDGDLPLIVSGAAFVVQEGDGEEDPQEPQVTDVQNLSIISSARYEFKFTWDAPLSGADKYRIYRKNPRGDFVLIGEVAGLEFVDKDGISGGGNIAPQVDYLYRIVAVKGGLDSLGVNVGAKEIRGLKGDFNRSDRVDGRDLQLLSDTFGMSFEDEGFGHLNDSNYDGEIDGLDLLEVAANWAKTYK
jgi:hypothetical protein